MPRIIIHCPATGQEVPTGHRTQDLDLNLMEGARSFRCPVCHSVHAWSRDEAQVEPGPPARSPAPV
jgi:LSD1 subclass zinc finger protein